jgi:hypothetical protein
VAEAPPPAESCLPPVLDLVERDLIERDLIEGDSIKGDSIKGEMIKAAPSLSHQRPGGAGATHLKQQLSHLPESP